MAAKVVISADDAKILTLFLREKTTRHLHIYICACHKWQSVRMCGGHLSPCAPSCLVSLRVRRAARPAVLVLAPFLFFSAPAPFLLRRGRQRAYAFAPFNPPPQGRPSRKRRKYAKPARVRAVRPAVPVAPPVPRCSGESARPPCAPCALRARTYIYM